jgi:glycosyltransferase involved in cell wall biosynthesis
LVPPADAGALADAITQLSRDKGLRRKFGEAGRLMVESEYSAERVGTDIVTLYDQLLDCKR